jgi:two-component system phosphate regulon sensor histidine kinase PhoR
MMFRSLRWRIAIVYSVLLLMALTLVTNYYLNYIHTSMFEVQKARLTREAWLVASIAEQQLATRPDGTDLDALTKSTKAQLGTRVTFVRADGVVWGDSDEDFKKMEGHSNRMEIRQAIDTGSGASVRESTTLGYQMLYVAVPVVKSGQLVGVARLSEPMADVDALTGHLERAAIIAAAMLTLLAILVAVSLARAVTAPVHELARVAQQLAAGNLGQRVSAPGRDEIGELATTFNRMAGALQDSVEAITLERNQTAAVFTHMVDAVFIVETDGMVALVNPAGWRMLGRSPSSVAGRSFASVVRDHQLVAIYQACMEANGAEQERYFELGSTGRFVRVVALGIPGQQGRRTLILAEDLSELRRMEEVRREFAANASHELRTPLASLRAVVETLEAGVEEPEMANRFLERMHVELDRLTQMTNELIELSRIESSQINPRRQPIDLGTVARAAVEMLRAQAERAHLELTVTTSEGLPLVQADASQIQTVLTNLIHNAIKFTPPGGEVQVSYAVTQDGVVRISVTDTGGGIPAEDLPRIFERFYKSDKSRSSGGTGLGLAIAKHIIQAHGGRIWADSVEGQGSTFSFTLPVTS